MLQPFRQALNLTETSQFEAHDCLIFDKQIEIIIDAGVPICSFTFGLPSREIVEKLKRHHIIVIGTATTVQEAIANEKVGMDMVVMQGSEAGGHRGTFLGPFEDALIGTTALAPQAVDHINIPVIAAGGIMDGRGVLSALILGAQAVQMGTAFVTCSESGAKRQHKEAILNCTEDELAITTAFSGKPARGVRNDFMAKMAKHEKDLPKYPIQNSLTQPIRREAAKQNRSEWMSLWCGQNPRSSKQQSASDIIADILLQVEQTIKNKINKW